MCAVIFVIDDNGRGMRPHELRRVFEPVRKSTIRHGGVAMRNIRERIELYYGTEYGIAVESEYRQGTRVTVTLPARKRTDQDG